jgi:flagellar biosynthesis/type III secretory pathway protein FliH
VVQTLFNQPHPARAAVPWQPNAGIAEKLSSRGYATTQWTSDAPVAFAELGFPAKPSGFSAAHYQSSQQTLNPQAQASLALLEGENRNEGLDDDMPASVAGKESNEHLPFVTDAFGASRKSKLGVKLEPSVLQRALAQAEMAESLVVSRITSDEKMADPIVIHPDVADAVQSKPDTSGVLDAPDAQDAPAAVAAAHEALAMSEAPAPAAVAGVSLEALAQREAEQFAKGMAQAREEAATALAEAVAQATEHALAQGMAQGKAEGWQQGMAQGKAEGLAQGMEQGIEQGLQQGLEQGLEQGLDKGNAQGMAAGQAKARAELADEMAAQRVVFENAATELNALIADPKKFFEPLKRLALHMAEQLVVGELQTSSKAIERLVQRCLDELDHPVHGAVVLELNAEDKTRLQAHGGDFIKGMRLEAVPDLKMGSVRVMANDTVVEDLVEHRLEGLAKALLVDVDAWREKSPLAQVVSDVQQEEAEDGDVHS